MAIHITCDSCGAEFKAKDEYAGKRGRCPECKQSVMVPQLQSDDEEEPVEVLDEDEPRKRRSRRPQVAENSLPPAALAAAIAAALIGAVVWAVIVKTTDYEIGWIAVGIGALIGAVAGKLGARGFAAGVVAAALALLSIAGGKVAGFSLILTDLEEESIAENCTLAVYEETRADAEGFAALGEAPSDEELIEYMVEHRFTEGSMLEVAQEEIDYFTEEQAPYLRLFEQDSPSFESWSQEIEREVRASWAEAGSPLENAIENLEFLDLIFAAFGISTAFGLVNKRR